MTETYPSDSELLNLQSDSETGVEYIPTGTAPYYLHFRRLLYRLLLAARRANDLRVYDEGGLDVGVKAGKFWLGAELISYAGSTGNALAPNKAGIYIYLDAQGTLVMNEYGGFPSMAIMPHIRLAVASTSGADILSITDCRIGHNFLVPHASGAVCRSMEAHITDDTLMAGESGSVHTNLGATGAVVLALPIMPPAGTEFTFAVQTPYALGVDPGPNAIIRDDTGQPMARHRWASTVGACLTLVADSYGDWVPVAKYGTWGQEA
ncbi:MAG: hypothetical protein A2Y77_12595 [Planctomycetes bacterium RBG_13_62_9]|nr:MAG: hypothetical protein A2Y77_12595 [Planctomycetes bacterium RBG_13_62_9]